MPVSPFYPNGQLAVCENGTKELIDLENSPTMLFLSQDSASNFDLLEL
jgi:hypothetical protein